MIPITESEFMIYGEIVTDQIYYEVYPGLLKFLGDYYSDLEFGLQGDAYIWIKSAEQLVSLDTFTSVRFQIKSNGIREHLVKNVISILSRAYEISIYEMPEPEYHE